MRALALAALLLGCKGPPPDPNCLTVFFSPPPYLVLGDPNERVEIKLPSPITCPPEVSLTVVAGILAPDNASHPVESARIEGIYAVVTFTPDRPGTYHVTARIEPNVGVTQGDVIVPVDRRSELHLLPLELETCAHIDLTPGGLAVCLDDGVSVYADGVLVQRLDAGAKTVMGEGVIWTATGERWAEGVQRDGGRGFARDPDSSLARTASLLLGPTARDVVTIDGAGWVRRLRYSDGGISVDDLVRFSTDFEAHSWWRGGDTIMLNAGVLGCAPVDAGITLCGASTEADVAVEPAGMWGIGLGRITLERGDGGARLAVPQMQQKFDAQVRSREWDHGLVVPFTVGDQIQEYAVSYRSGDVVLERFTERGVRTVHSSTGDWVFAKYPLRAFRKGVAP